VTHFIVSDDVERSRRPSHIGLAST